MATIAHCDTHVVLWLYAGDIERFSIHALSAIEKHDLMISPIVRLELEFLHEIHRVKEKPERILKTMSLELGLKVCHDPFESVVLAAEPLHWTRDPFDRLIVAQALLHHLPLISKDDLIRKHYTNCIW
jgi:PIN domain nuclease of toxin-antitoxin system